MSTNPNDVPSSSREQFGMPSTDEIRRNQDIPTVAVATSGGIPSGQLDWIMSTIATLESRMAAADQQAGSHRFQNRLETPIPPYAVPLSTAVRTTQPLQHPLHTAVTDNQYPPQPFITSFPHFQDVPPLNRPPNTGFLPPPPPQHYMAPSMYGSDPWGSYRPYSSNIPQGSHMLTQYGHFSSSERPVYSPLPGPRPTSCWYPSNDRLPRGNQSHDQHRGVRLDPPRFDGTDTTNWIFKIQYYFDHMMMPDANRLHYVVPLFDPPASEWIKHYCSNNDYVTWQDFLNEVRYDSIQIVMRAISA